MTETSKLRKLIMKRGTLEILIPLCYTTNPVRYMKFKQTLKGSGTWKSRHSRKTGPPRVEYRLTLKGQEQVESVISSTMDEKMANLIDILYRGGSVNIHIWIVKRKSPLGCLFRGTTYGIKTYFSSLKFGLGFGPQIFLKLLISDITLICPV